MARCACNNFLEPRLSNLQSTTYLFSTQAFLLQQKVANSVVKKVSSVDKGQLSAGHKEQSKSTQASKKKKNKKGAKSVEEVKDAKSNEVKSNVVQVNSAPNISDSTANSQSKPGQQKKTKITENSKKKKSKKSAKTVEAVKSTNSNKVNDVNNVERKQSVAVKQATGMQADIKLSSTSQLKQHKDKNTTKTNSEYQQSNEERKGGDISKDLVKQKDFDTKCSKASETLPVIECLGNDEVHSLDYSSEAVLIAAEEDLHGGSHVSDLADMDVGSTGLQSKAETHSESEPGQHFESEHSEVSGPRTFKEGTPGGRLFKEETLAEIDAYLYLGKVSCDWYNTKRE